MLLLLETQELASVLTGRWGESCWSPTSVHDATPPPHSAWAPLVGDARDADGWQYATCIARVGAPRDGGRGVRRPTDRVRWREWGLAPTTAAGCPAAEPPAELDLADDGPSEPETRETVSSFLRLMLTTIWKSSRFGLPPDLASFALLNAKHALVYEATFRPLLSAPCDVDARRLAELRTGMVHARAAFGYAALRGHFASVRACVAGFVTHGGYRHVDSAAHRAAACAITGMSQLDIRAASWASSALVPAHYVGIDHRMRWVVLSIRGTHSFADILIDLHAAPHAFALPNARAAADEREGSVHAGMLAAARGLLRSAAATLAECCAEYPEYQLVVVGHSLGAGTAALLTALLRHPDADDEGAPAPASDAAAPAAAPASDEGRGRAQLRRAVCLAFSPPAIADIATARALAPYVTSVIVGADAVPRLCAANALQLCAELEKESAYSLITSSRAWRVAEEHVFGLMRAVGAMRHVPALPTEPGDDEASAAAAAAAAETRAAVARALPLEALCRGGRGHHFPPGQIIHLCDRPPVDVDDTRAVLADAEGEPAAALLPVDSDAIARAVAPADPGACAARVAACDPAHYSKLLLLPEMIADHLPDRVLALLERASQNVP